MRFSAGKVSEEPLPGAAAWRDFWTGRRYAGGSPVTAPLDVLPIHVRPGSVLPLRPVVPHAQAGANAPLEIRVYRGADGAFTLHGDEGQALGRPGKVFG
ncbi:hypothetical protein [Caulobacter sp. BK020]|uniref:hypothetical protein n=1 Tax=Caulobacter sp. BK020 TaxID=2512117 RepID=UPI0010E75756|nr:hypothetical protein [Caulobacter sp. BK020]TCS10316.1 hypothetical protein EV278_11854 [Caulobacter sp. BK020]